MSEQKFKFVFKYIFAVLPELMAVPLDASKLQGGQTTVVPKQSIFTETLEKPYGYVKHIYKEGVKQKMKAEPYRALSYG